MRPDDLLELLRARPFRPFRVYVSDGTVYEIHHPEWIIVERSKALVAIPLEGLAGHMEHYEIVALLHITRLKPIRSVPSSNAI